MNKQQLTDQEKQDLDDLHNEKKLSKDAISRLINAAERGCIKWFELKNPKFYKYNEDSKRLASRALVVELMDKRDNGEKLSKKEQQILYNHKNYHILPKIDDDGNLIE